ncbi:MAG TPA: TraB/GumN family protein [Steroidobacteraceae bacterium]|nr:TraB/GumN family protein [Steroidobacteraceae bacterium]
MLLAGLGAGARAQPGDAQPLEEVVVTGEYPGPGMWKITSPAGAQSGPRHVLWIVGDPPPLPRRMKWKSRDVESVAQRAQAFLLDASVRMEPDEKIGVFRGLSLLPAALKARRNPDGATLREHVPADLYARWLVQKQRYLGRDRGVEQWRPIFAASKLRKEAFDDLGLREGGIVWGVVGKIARRRRIEPIRPNLEFKFHTRDLKAKIREFSREPLTDTECFAATLDLTEALSDGVTQARRAHAWATADLATLDSLPPLPNPYVPCAMAVLGSEVARELIPADIRERLYVSWMDAAAQALLQNETTLAIVPLAKLTRDGGYLTRLRARGYAVEAPR